MRHSRQTQLLRRWPRRATTANSRGEQGQAMVEFAGTLWILIACALVAWELGLAGWTATVAANAARTTARAYSRVGDSGQAVGDGYDSLEGDGFSRSGATVAISGEQAKVTVDLPIVVPWIHVPIAIDEQATMPETG